eukprot:6074010-Amphidinium_carterae.1
MLSQSRTFDPTSDSCKKDSLTKTLTKPQKITPVCPVYFLFGTAANLVLNNSEHEQLHLQKDVGNLPTYTVAKKSDDHPHYIARVPRPEPTFVQE